MESVSVEDFIKAQKYHLIHILDVVREEKWTEEEIAETLIDLYKRGLIVFAYHGNFVEGGVLGWTEKEWKDAQGTGWFRNSILRANYKKGIKKKELISMRKIVRFIFIDDGPPSPGFSSASYRRKYNWGFFRRKVQ